MADVQQKTLDTEHKQEYRILLIGKTGAGKSSTGNSIVGKPVFPTSLGMQSETKSVQYGETSIHGRKMLVVDSPGFYDTVKGNANMSRELTKIFGLLAPGFHALLFVMSPERFTKECRRTQSLFFKVFGPGVARYTVIVITGKDRLEAENMTLEKFIRGGNTQFKSFMNMCNNRILALNNKASGSELESQVKRILDMIEVIQTNVGHRCFTNLHLQTMKLYKGLGRMEGKLNIRKARQTLFKRISERFGTEEQSVWGPDKPGTKKLKLTLRELRDKEADIDVEEIDASSEDEDADDTEYRKEILGNKSYFERLLDFFSRLLESIFKA